MARFTVLSRDEVAALAGAFGLGTLREVRPLDAGTINSNFELDCARGRFFLRINEGKVEADVAYEAELVIALASAGVATPEPRRAADGRPFLVVDGRLVSVFPWIEGRHRALGEVTVSDAAAVGAELARLHLATAALAGRFERDGIYTTPRIAERVEGFADTDDPAVAAVVPLLQAELAWLERARALRSATPRGVIHGDLFRDNVLFRGDRVVALLDFEQAASGALVYDLAVVLNAWCYVERLDLALVAALLAGYATVRPLDADERAAIAIEVRAAATRFAVTRITDVHVPRGEVEGKDFRRYVARLVAWRELGPKPLQALV